MKATPPTLTECARPAAVALILLAVLACGGAGQSTTSEPAAVAPPPAAPALDCTAYVDKVSSCADAFEPAYAKTHLAAQVGAGDGEKGARMYTKLFRAEHNKPMAVSLCEGKHASNAKIRAGLADCDATADCETWSACAAPVIGAEL